MMTSTTQIRASHIVSSEGSSSISSACVSI